MVGGRASFEIQALHDGRWLTEDYRETELTARAHARTVFGRPNRQGIRIVKHWARADGLVTENVIYTEMREQTAPKVTIVPVDEAPYCRKIADYYRAESRMTINRLFRKYVDQVFLTPTELIHNYKALKKVQDVDMLFPAAVDRVATLQAREAGEEPRTRRDEIYRAVAQITDKARRAESYPNLPKLASNDFDMLVTRIERMVPPGESDFYTLVALSRELVKYRNWLGKLERLAGLTHPGQAEQSLALLDGVLADFFGVASALQDVLGYQRNLGEAICAILDLCEGRFAAEKSDARDQIAVIAPLIADGRLEQTRQSLIDRALRQLSSAQPLSRDDPSHEVAAFRRVALRLLRPDGLIGGADAAVALTRRYVQMQEVGGQAGLRRAVSGVVAAAGDSLFSVVYLLQLVSTPLGVELAEEISATLLDKVGSGTIDGLVPKDGSIRDKLSRMSSLYEKLAAARILSDDLRLRLLDHLDRLLGQFVKGQGIIEKLDDPKAPLRDRATRLIEFCAANVLPKKSKVHELACNRVVALLKQPNFDARFVEGITDPTHRDDSLRKFHALLEHAGFKLCRSG